MLELWPCKVALLPAHLEHVMAAKVCSGIRLALFEIVCWNLCIALCAADTLHEAFLTLGPATFIRSALLVLVPCIAALSPLRQRCSCCRAV